MATIFIPLIKLLCAHICADFIFQTDKINEGKHSEGRKRLYYLCLHSLIHALTAYIFVAQWTNWIIPLTIFITHFAIDFAKCRIADGIKMFIADQVAHIAVIAILWFALFVSQANDLSALCFPIQPISLWAICVAYLLMFKPSAILLSLFLKQWMPDTTHSRSLPNAGKWIGYLERTLILTFIAIGSFEGIGFLLVAKSVFRFGELNKAKDIKTTEYVMIGTLASFAIAILVGVLLKVII